MTIDTKVQAPPQANVVSVTPSMAALWLAANKQNRGVSKSALAAYVKDMQEGRWLFTGEPISFDADGHLLNGQHRLTAIIQSGVTLPFLVVRGLASEAQDAMDKGRKRSVSDQLGISGYASTGVLAALAKMVLAYEAGTLMGQQGREFTHTQIMEVAKSNSWMQHAAVIGDRYFQRGLRLPPTSLAMLVWLAGPTASGDVEAWMQSMVESRTDGVGDPRLALLRRLASASLAREKVTSAEWASALVRCWNASVQGDQMTIVKFRTSATGPIEIPPTIINC